MTRFLNKRIAVIVVVSTIMICYCIRRIEKFSPSSSNSGSIRSSETKASVKARKPKLGDGCYHIFLDVGANIGVTTRFVMESEKFPKAPIRKFFAQHYGPEATRDNRDFCAFSFEPNPQHRPYHLEMAEAYKAQGWRYHPVQAGVAPRAGSITFWHTNYNEVDVGFSMNEKKCGESKRTNMPCTSEQVDVLRLSDWMDEEINGRIIPEPFGTYDANEKPKVVMKLDVESMEFAVIPELFLSGSLCNIVDAVSTELHVWEDIFPINFTDVGGLSFQTAKEAKTLVEACFDQIKRDPDCKTQILLLDDESYGLPGEVPFP